jgi:hypothetical protein
MSSEKIRLLNDTFRLDPQRWGRLMITAGVNDKGPVFVLHAVQCVRTFAEFNDDNDPHGEHDFGSFKLLGEKLFWKIDYYDKTMEYGSEDPSDQSKTTRVLTIMLAEEY